METDYLIIGQGIAGTLLSYYLLKQGKKVIVADNGAVNSSYVAAGMFNPVTGRRLSLSWKAKVFLPAAHEAYTELEELLEEKFYFPLPVLRLITADEEFEAIKKSVQGSSSSIFISHFWERLYIEGIKNKGAACQINGSGYIQTRVLLPAYRNYLKSNGFLNETEFNYNNLNLLHDGIEWEGVTAKKIIFCEGYKCIFNPYFNYLPFNTAKGDVFTVYAPQLQINTIINRSVYIVPLGNGYFRFGSTYKWNDLDPSPKEDGFEELSAELDQLLDVPYQITEHMAGIRPAVKQRRPFIGLHPQHKQMGIFNGLGTKGIMLAPYLAQQFTGHLLNNLPLDAEADIARYAYMAPQENA